MPITETSRDNRIRLRRRIDVDALCACTADQLCLFHYAELDPGRQPRARKRAGVHEPYLDRR